MLLLKFTKCPPSPHDKVALAIDYYISVALALKKLIYFID